MAKTFKNLPRPSEPATSKPTSARDFFDLSDESPNLKKPIPSPKATGAIHPTDNSSNTSNTINAVEGVASGAATKTGSSGNSLTTRTIPITASDLTANDPAAAPDGVRQTFVLSRNHLERLRDYVHARRAGGEYTYSQKQALQEALDLLFADAAPAAPRPAQTRAQEQERGQRIRQGRRARPAGT